MPRRFCQRRRKISLLRMVRGVRFILSFKTVNPSLFHNDIALSASTFAFLSDVMTAINVAIINMMVQKRIMKNLELQTVASADNCPGSYS